MVRFRKTVWRNSLVVKWNIWNDCLGKINLKAGEVCSVDLREQKGVEKGTVFGILKDESKGVRAVVNLPNFEF